MNQTGLSVFAEFLFFVVMGIFLKGLRNYYHAGASMELTRTSFLFTNSWMPKLESSRP